MKIWELIDMLNKCIEMAEAQGYSFQDMQVTFLCDLKPVQLANVVGGIGTNNNNDIKPLVELHLATTREMHVKISSMNEQLEKMGVN